MSDVIALYSLPSREQFGVILFHPGGLLYSNQTGGVSCNHPTARGHFFSFGRYLPESVDIEGDLHGIVGCGAPNFYAMRWMGELNQWFAQHGLPFRVDITSNEIHEEAWIPVTLGPCRGILTWNNCD